ncbi:MAG: cytochrome P450 [Myxococcota bacterium]|nr:cytochrome P450 [Myxococcota bacterium]
MSDSAAPALEGVNLLDGEFYAGDPHPAFAWMREHEPVYWDANGRVFGITRHAHVMEAAKSPDRFGNRHGMRADAPAIPSMINFDGREHKRRRNLVNSGFTPRRVADLEPRVRDVVGALIDAVCERGECDFVADLAAPLPMILIGDMLGVEPEDRADLLRWSDDLILGQNASAPPEVMANAARAFQEYSEYNRRVVADRRSRPRGDDLMSILVHAEIEGERLGDEEILQEGLLILVGGDETTRHVISGGMHQLLRHPDQRRLLQEDPSRIPTAVEEMLRWVTPIQNMARTALRDVSFHGREIREGQKILLLYPSANRDETVFDEPFRFDVTRSPNEHVAFGGYGPHFCLGHSLARLELRVMFEELLRRLPDMVLGSDERPPMRPSNFITGIERLPVRFTPAPRRSGQAAA